MAADNTACLLEMRHKKEMITLKRDAEKAKQEATQKNMMMMKGIMRNGKIGPPSFLANFSLPRLNTDDKEEVSILSGKI